MTGIENHLSPAHHGDAAAELAALERSAAIVDLSHKAVMRLSGRDPVGMLNAILTNSVSEEESAGAYAALLDQKGRVQTDLRILKSGEDIMVITEPEGAEAAKSILGRYAPFSRTKLEDLSEEWTVVGLYGPRAAELLGLELAGHETAEVEVGHAMVLAVGVAVPTPGLDLILPRTDLSAVREHLLSLGATPVSREACETARIAAGIPRFGSDLTPDNFPGECETFLERAVSFEKGCYPGQETVARMRYRGHPNKTLHRFVLKGKPPAPGTEISQNDKRAGTVTSVAPLPVDGTTFALGYLSRKADPNGTLLAGNTTLIPA